MKEKRKSSSVFSGTLVKFFQGYDIYIPVQGSFQRPMLEKTYVSF